MRTILSFCVLMSLTGCANNGQDSIADLTSQSDVEIQTQILALENAWAQVDVTNDRSVFEKIIAPDFHSTSSRSGKRRDRAEWLANWQYENVKSAVHINPAVQVFSPTLAVYTGIDETRGNNPDGTEWVHQDICTDTWLKRNGMWQCIAAHCSRLK